MFWTLWSTIPKSFGQALQCGLVHLWVHDLMVLMLMGVVSPGGGGCPGRAAFTKVLERVGFLRYQTWGGEGKRVEREGSSEIRCQCLVRSELKWT